MTATAAESVDLLGREWPALAAAQGRAAALGMRWARVESSVAARAGAEAGALRARRRAR